MGVHDKENIESLLGPLWSGVESITVGDTIFTLPRIKRAFDLEADDVVGIDLSVLSEGNFAFRFYDGDDRRIVVFVFDGDLNILAEHRAHIAEWLGDDYYKSGLSAFMPEEMLFVLRQKVQGRESA
jgi:hypothetical protein